MINEKRPAVAKALEQEINNNSPFTHESAVKALAQWAGPENVQMLTRLADSNDQWVLNRRGGPAVEALLRMRDKDANAQTSLIKILAKRLETDSRADASDLLSQIGPAAENEVLTYMDDPKGWPNGTAAEEARQAAGRVEHQRRAEIESGVA